MVFILYNNALLVAKSNLEQGSVHPIVGLWWVHLLMVLIIFIFYLYRHRKFGYYLDKIADRFFSKEEANAK